VDLDVLREKFAALAPTLNERSRRIYAATEARALGRGGIAALSKVTGLSRPTIALGLAELRGEVPSTDPSRIRRPGGGRTRLVEKDPRVMTDLESLVEPGTRGDPESPLRWTSNADRGQAGAGDRGIEHQWPRFRGGPIAG